MSRMSFEHAPICTYTIISSLLFNTTTPRKRTVVANPLTLLIMINLSVNQLTIQDLQPIAQFGTNHFSSTTWQHPLNSMAGQLLIRCTIALLAITDLFCFSHPAVVTYFVVDIDAMWRAWSKWFEASRSVYKTWEGAGALRELVGWCLFNSWSNGDWTDMSNEDPNYFLV